MSLVKIRWPNGDESFSESGVAWLDAASKSHINIPTGCLSGSCGACEIEVNGKVVRACISNVPENDLNYLEVDYSDDPYW
tara:strand:- start:611 stop:850 length:240 start_codon:yes stop_codon:yes gene_type:complete